MKIVLLSTLLLALPIWCRAQPVIEASGELPADALDPLGDTIGGIGSAIAYDAKNDVFICLPDRGAGDGTVPYRPRYLVLKLRQSGNVLQPVVEQAVLLRDTEGRPMTGLIPDDREAAAPRMKDGRTSLDPEAVALAPDGTIYLSEEYAPALYQFRRDGSLVRRVDMPEEFQPTTAEGKRDFTDQAKLVSGRAINQGPEGMCLLPDGRTVALIFQSGLIQDGGRQSPFTRLLLLDLATGQPTAAYRYPFATQVGSTPLDLGDISVNDLAVLPDGRFLVLERDKFGRNGKRDFKPTAYKAVWLVDTKSATNLLTAEKDAEIRPVAKTLLFNLPDLVPDASTLSAKWESIVPLPESTPESLVLLMAADNDFLTPEVVDDGVRHTFKKAKEPVPTQFFKIRVPLP